MEINFTKEKLKKFKKEYEKAVNNKQLSFSFEENEILVSYAKYVIEHLENKFKK